MNHVFSHLSSLSSDFNCQHLETSNKTVLPGVNIQHKEHEKNTYKYIYIKKNHCLSRFTGAACAVQEGERSVLQQICHWASLYYKQLHLIKF